MSSDPDLDQRLSRTLPVKAEQVDAEQWPPLADIVARPPRFNAAPPRTPTHPGVWIIVGVLAITMAVLTTVYAVDVVHTTSPVARSSTVTTTNPGEASQVAAAVAAIPDSVFRQVAQGSAHTTVKILQGDRLTSNGRPEVLFVGEEWCPFCASQRWALVAALSRFGTFSDLGLTQSASDDTYPNTATFTFHGSSYKSTTIVFVGREISSAQRLPLDVLTSDEERVVSDANPRGAVPFIDMGGRYATIGTGVDPGVLASKTAPEIAAAMADPSTDISQAVIGDANVLIRNICQLTGGQPTEVCRA